MDFLALYRELGVNPGACNLSEFKLAYRRRMQQLHPDRNPESGDDSMSDALQGLMAVYREALAFERRFGRLPGAESASGRSAVAPTPSGSPVARFAAAAPADDRRPPWRRLTFVAAMLLVLAWVLWGTGLLAF